MSSSSSEAVQAKVWSPFWYSLRPNVGCGARGRRADAGPAVDRRRIEAGELHGFARGEGALEDGAGGVHGDALHVGPPVARQVGRAHRRQHGARAAAGRREHRPPLQVARLRAGDGLAGRVAVGGRPVAPGVVGRVRVARPGRDGDRAAAVGPPADHAPGRDGLGVAHVREVGALGARCRREAEHLARVRRDEHQPALRVSRHRGDLLRGGAAHQRHVRGVRPHAEDLALGPGADEHAAGFVRDDVVRHVRGRLPDRFPHAVGRDAVDGALRARGPALARRGRARGARPARIDDGERHDVGRDRGHGSRRGRRALRFVRCRRLAGLPVHGRRVDGAARVHVQRVDLLERRVEQHEALPGAIDAEHAPGVARAREQAAVLVDGEGDHVGALRVVEAFTLAVRRDPVDEALLARTGVDGPVGAHGERPDVLVVGVEEDRRGPVGRNAVDLAVGRRRRVDAAAGRGRERVHLHLGRVERGGQPAVGADPQHLSVVAAADPGAAPRRGQDRPEGRGGRLGDERDGRTERQAPEVVDRQAVDLALEEIGLGRDHPEGGARRVEQDEPAQNGPRGAEHTCNSLGHVAEGVGERRTGVGHRALRAAPVESDRQLPGSG